METCYTCQTCQNTSQFSDWFTDLHLAIPGPVKSDSQNQKILAQQETLKQAFSDLSSNSSPSTPGTECADISSTKQDPMSVSDLIQHYLAPELLTGGNQYQCDHCNMLRDAVKTVCVCAGPEYLNITLLRFKYDRATQRRAKVFTAVDYPEYLSLPVSGAVSLYRLYSVVVHSGYSSDGGHYYTWCHNHTPDTAWIVLNDSVATTTSTWDTFKQQTSKLSRDTAYLLFYQRQPAQGETEGVPNSLVMDRVIRDNIKYIRERENMGVRFQPPPAADRRDDEDDDGGSSGCNDNFGQFGGARCVF